MNQKDKTQYHTVIRRLVVGQMQANCYIIMNKLTQEAVILDPGDDAEYITDTLHRLQTIPVCILASHGHFDHIMAAYEIQSIYAIPFLIHKNDIFLARKMQESARYFLNQRVVDLPPKIDKTLLDGEVMTFGNIALSVIHTPGHTPGSVSFYLKQENTLFIGDTLFSKGAVGRTDFSYSNPTDLTKSITHILSFPDKTILYAGHGEKTHIQSERAYHAFA